MKNEDGTEKPITNEAGEIAPSLKRWPLTDSTKIDFSSEPDHDQRVSQYTFANLIDITLIEQLLDSFYVMTGIQYSVLDNNNNILMMKGWQEICTKFHRACPQTEYSKAMDRNIPIIAVTAYAFEEDRHRILDNGADGYIRKPFDEEELFEIIKSVLGVQYIYDNDIIPVVKKENKADNTDFTLAKLPEALVNSIREAASDADYFNLLELLAKVAEFSPEGFRIMHDLANNFQYHKLLEILGDE